MAPHLRWPPRGAYRLPDAPGSPPIAQHPPRLFRGRGDAIPRRGVWGRRPAPTDRPPQARPRTTGKGQHAAVGPHPSAALWADRPHTLPAARGAELARRGVGPAPHEHPSPTPDSSAIIHHTRRKPGLAPTPRRNPQPGPLHPPHEAPAPCVRERLRRPYSGDGAPCRTRCALPRYP